MLFKNVSINRMGRGARKRCLILNLHLGPTRQRNVRWGDDDSCGMETNMAFPILSAFRRPPVFTDLKHLETMCLMFQILTDILNGKQPGNVRLFDFLQKPFGHFRHGKNIQPQSMATIHRIRSSSPNIMKCFLVASANVKNLRFRKFFNNYFGSKIYIYYQALFCMHACTFSDHT